MLVFRDGRRRLTVRPLLEQLEASCRRVESHPSNTGSGAAPAVLEALLRAGELECGLADAGAPAAECAALTDALASRLVSGEQSSHPSNTGSGAAPTSWITPAQVDLSVPEGFAYYALHPLDYADAMAAHARRGGGAVVVGIRSIGTTLSAMTRAALAARGVEAERFTVRPMGHPWDRRLEFGADEMRVVEAGKRGNAEFFVVDEGPGLSGSSFLAVAEALERAGVERGRITLIGSHEVDAVRLCARDAAARWQRFRFVAVGAPTRVPEGNEWRTEHVGWRQFERRKVLAADGKTLFKFEGLGHYGDAVIGRARRLAELGFAPRVDRAQDGFAAYEFVPGEPMWAEGLSDAVIRRLAEYCAMRAREFRADGVDTGALAELVAVNSREGLGQVLAAELVAVRPVIADGKMQPHEWLRSADGRMVKIDGASRGDDHFFPGPTDIAWDLAGASVEWEMTAAAEERLLAEYLRRSGDDARSRMAGWKRAYALFRLGYCEMAAGAGETVMRREAERYRALLVPAVSVAA